MWGSAKTEFSQDESIVLVCSWRKWASMFMIAASVLIASEDHAHSQVKSQEAELQFDIPAQSLESALEAYGAISHLQILYETAFTAGRHSVEVKGVYTQEAALRRLLSESGLSFANTEERAFTLVPAPDRSQAGPPRGIADFNEYLGRAQAIVLAALCRQPETRPGTFRLAVQFSIGGAGKLENPNLLSTTGVTSRDAAITDLLTQLAFGQTPPPGMPQPITMVLRAGPPDGDDECGAMRH